MHLLLFALGCGADAALPYPDAATYDAACTEPTDCTVVEVDDCSCSCDQMALSTAGASAFEADVQAYWDASATGCQLGCDPQCETFTATCEQDTCALAAADSG